MQIIKLACVTTLSFLLVACATETEYTGNFVRLNQPHRIIEHNFDSPYLVAEATEPESVVTEQQALQHIVDEEPTTVVVAAQKKVSRGPNRWAVQVIALDKGKTDDITVIKDHIKMVGFPTYVVEENQLGKVRLGRFLLQDAKLVLNIVKEAGYSDAFLLKEENQ